MTARLDVQLDSPHLTLAPGDAGQVHLTVSNQGDIVDAGLLSIGGLAAEWFTLPPGDVRLFPGESATVVLDLHPPDTAGPAGIHPFQVSIVSRDNPAARAMAPGYLDIAPAGAVLAALTPQRVTGRRGTFALTVTNRANRTRAVLVHATDVEEALQYTLGMERPTLLDPPPDAEPEPPPELGTVISRGAGVADYQLDMEPGTAVVIPVQVRPRRARWFGREISFPFEVRVGPPGIGHEPSAVQSTGAELVYRPRLIALAGLPVFWRRAFAFAIPLLLLGLMAFLVTRPTPAATLPDLGATQTALAGAAQQTALAAAAQETAQALAAQQTASAASAEAAAQLTAGAQTAVASAAQQTAVAAAQQTAAVQTAVAAAAQQTTVAVVAQQTAESEARDAAPRVAGFYLDVPTAAAGPAPVPVGPDVAWDVHAAQNLRVDQTVQPAQTPIIPTGQLVNYQLVVTGTTGVLTRTLDVLLVRPPSFTALDLVTTTLHTPIATITPAQSITMTVGQVITLTEGTPAGFVWKVPGALQASIDGTAVPLDPTGRAVFQVTPGPRHTYFITASNAAGTTGRAVTLVYVTPTPVCLAPDYAVQETQSAPFVPALTDVGNHCAGCGTHIALPFPYLLYDKPFTDTTVLAGGALQFGAAPALSAGACLPDANAQHTIFAYWGTLRTNARPGDGVFTALAGTAPHRIFTIEWRATTAAGAPAHFEVRLYEGEQRYDVVYAPTFEDSGTGLVGVQEDPTGRYTEYECNAPRAHGGLALTFYRPACGQEPIPSCNAALPTATATATPTVTGTAPTATPTSTGTPPTATPTQVPVVLRGCPTNPPTATVTATATATQTATATATATATPSPSPSATATTTTTATASATATQTATATATASATATPTATATASATATTTPTPPGQPGGHGPTWTPTATPTARPAVTAPPRATATATRTPVPPTVTPVPPSPTPTATPPFTPHVPPTDTPGIGLAPAGAPPAIDVAAAPADGAIAVLCAGPEAARPLYDPGCLSPPLSACAPPAAPAAPGPYASVCCTQTVLSTRSANR